MTYSGTDPYLIQFALCTPPALWHIWDVSTLTIELPDDLAARLEATSAQTHVPPDQLVCAALEKALQTIDKNLERQTTRKAIPEGAKEAALARIVTATETRALEPATVIPMRRAG